MDTPQTLYADKAILTAGFYTEYLGFKELERQKKQNSTLIRLRLNDQELLIASENSDKDNKSSIEFRIDGIDGYYFSIKDKVRIRHVLSHCTENIWKFTYLDCEGNSVTISGELGRTD